MSSEGAEVRRDDQKVRLSRELLLQDLQELLVEPSPEAGPPSRDQYKKLEEVTMEMLKYDDWELPKFHLYSHQDPFGMDGAIVRLYQTLKNHHALILWPPSDHESENKARYILFAGLQATIDDLTWHSCFNEPYRAIKFGHPPTEPVPPSTLSGSERETLYKTEVFLQTWNDAYKVTESRRQALAADNTGPPADDFGNHYYKLERAAELSMDRFTYTGDLILKKFGAEGKSLGRVNRIMVEEGMKRPHEVGEFLTEIDQTLFALQGGNKMVSRYERNFYRHALWSRPLDQKLLATKNKFVPPRPHIWFAWNVSRFGTSIARIAIGMVKKRL